MDFSKCFSVLLTLIGLMAGISGCGEYETQISYRPEGKSIKTDYYRVGIHPYLNSKQMFELYLPIFDYLEERMPGVRFHMETSQDYARYEEKLYDGRFHFSLPNPYQTLNSLAHGYRVIAKMKPDSVFRGIIVARKDSHLKEIAQLKGGTVSFPAPTALAATMMPKYFLWEKGLDVTREIHARYVGSQFSSIMNAYSGDAIAAATWPPPWEQWCKEHPEMAGEMELVWQTAPLVNNGFVVRSDVSPAVAAKVSELLASMEANKEGKALLMHAGFEGFEAADNDTFDAVGKFLKAYDAALGLPE